MSDVAGVKHIELALFHLCRAHEQLRLAPNQEDDEDKVRLGIFEAETESVLKRLESHIKAKGRIANAA